MAGQPHANLIWQRAFLSQHHEALRGFIHLELS
jgi:hypothetical protein